MKLCGFTPLTFFISFLFSYLPVYVDLPVTNGGTRNYFTVTRISHKAAQDRACKLFGASGDET